MNTFTDYISKEEKTILTYLDQIPKSIEYDKAILNDSYSPCDLIIRSKKTNKVYFIEFKTRQFESTRYKDTVIEKKKIDDIKSLAKRFNVPNPIILFVVGFSDGSIYQFNMEEYDYSEIKKCPIQTAGKDKGMIDKELIYFNINNKNKLI